MVGSFFPNKGSMTIGKKTIMETANVYASTADAPVVPDPVACLSAKVHRRKSAAGIDPEEPANAQNTTPATESTEMARPRSQ